jgi:precorrin-6B methylase 1
MSCSLLGSGDECYAHFDQVQRTALRKENLQIEVARQASLEIALARIGYTSLEREVLDETCGLSVKSRAHRGGTERNWCINFASINLVQ